MTGQNSQSLPSLVDRTSSCCSPGSRACRPSGTRRSTCPRRPSCAAPYTATSSAERSPQPRYHDTSRSPFGHSTMPGAWLCLRVQREDEFGGRTSGLRVVRGFGSSFPLGQGAGRVLLRAAARFADALADSLRQRVAEVRRAPSPRSRAASSPRPGSRPRRSSSRPRPRRGRTVPASRSSPAGTCPACRPCPAAGPASCGRCAAGSASTSRCGRPAARPARSSGSTPRAGTSPPARTRNSGPMSLPSIACFGSSAPMSFATVGSTSMVIAGSRRTEPGGNLPRPAGDERHAHAALPHGPLPLAQRPGAAGVVAVAQPRAVVAGEDHERVVAPARARRAPPGSRRPTSRSPGSRRRRAPACDLPLELVARRTAARAASSARRRGRTASPCSPR